MTHPSRDMIAQIVRNGMSRLAASQAGARPVVSSSKEADRVTDAILASLASSGDHAELARLAEAKQSWSLGIYKSREQANDAAKFNALDLPATVLALLAENAAMREREKAALKECGEWARQAGEAIGKLETSEAAGIVEGWRDRATEAERKLAEAVGLLRECLTWARKFPDLWGRISTFLSSKEAERG